MNGRVPLGDPTPCAVAVVVRGAKLLVIARRLDGREYAVLPGGGIEVGQSAVPGKPHLPPDVCITGTQPSIT